MSARNIVGGLAGAAVGAVKHPVGTAGEAISKAKGVVSAGTAVGTAVAGSVVGKVRGGSAPKDPAGAVKETVDKAADAAKETTDKAADAAKETTDKVAEAAKQTAKKAATKAPAKKSPAKRPAGKKAAPKRQPQVVLAEPAPPLEPPIDVVGQALAAEAQEDHVGAGRTTEPRGASRDEEHGEAALQRAEAIEIMEEIAEASSLGQIDIETPVGTTGADVANNPDTAEADLQQPGTEPLLDPSLTKAVKSEQETLHLAADPDKG